MISIRTSKTLFLPENESVSCNLLVNRNNFHLKKLQFEGKANKLYKDIDTSFNFKLHMLHIKAKYQDMNVGTKWV
jgi:hypothetical protein